MPRGALAQTADRADLGRLASDDFAIPAVGQPLRPVLQYQPRGLRPLHRPGDRHSGMTLEEYQRPKRERESKS